MTEPNVRCPACDRLLQRSNSTLGGYDLWACEGCGTHCAVDAVGKPVDYDAVYKGAEYVADQVVPVLSGVEAAAFASHPTYAPFFREVLPRGQNRLLDVGCGAGRFLLAAKHHGWTVSGVEPSAEAVRVLRERANLDVLHGDLASVVATGRKFDVVTAFEVLEHLADPVAFVRQARSLLAPGGVLFVTVPNWAAPSVQHATRADWLPPVHVSFFTGKGLEALLRRAGFAHARGGEIRGDPFPERWKSRPKWLARRLLRRPREALGVWGFALG